MPHKALKNAVINLLLLAVLLQPVLSLGQSMTEPSEPHSLVTQMATMDCCNGGSPSASGHTGQGMVCNDMALADCSHASSLGGCGVILSALIPRTVEMPSLSSSVPDSPLRQQDYLSIILDALTPPPNSSAA